MREIKFRAWEKSLQEIIPVHNIDFSSKQINTNGAWRLFNEIELMQYTGLKDKNGKEIYEGDVVRVESGDMGYRTDGTHLIEWWNGQFVFRANSNQEDDYINFGWWVKSNNNQPILSQVEVIGNIYESPELLEAAK